MLMDFKFSYKTARNLLFKRSFLLAVLLLPGFVAAENIYTYQDENGIWHFTDRLPDDQAEFETVYMEKEPEARISMRQEGTDHNPVYLVFNKYWGPAEVEISMQESVNVLTEPPLPARFVLSAQSEKALLGVGALDERRGFSYKLGLTWTPGRPMATPVGNIVVYPPFSADETYPIGQAFNGPATHTTPDSRYAVDISMPVGTHILAVRGGIVMDVEEDFNRAGTDFDKFADKANHVRILHDDGTMAQYAHLDLASVVVRPGSRIKAGRMIGRSGNTGFSTGPHLHFSIQQNTGMQLESVPFRFRMPVGEPWTPQARQFLTGTLPPR
jgi:murein DD-endopeptidase MepM/ murein hydrolase activator NlpD